MIWHLFLQIRIFFYLPKQWLQTGSEFMYEKLERSGNSDEHL